MSADLTPNASRILAELEAELCSRPKASPEAVQEADRATLAKQARVATSGPLRLGAVDILPQPGKFACRGPLAGLERLPKGWASRPGCGAVLEWPGGICDPCELERRRAEEMALRERAADWIPERFRWARPRAAELEDRVRDWGRVRKQAAEWIRAIEDGSRDCPALTLRGNGGSGKTSAACVFYARLIESTELAKFARFVPATDLVRAEHGEEFERIAERNNIFDRCVLSSLLLLDDVGAEDRRRSRISELIVERANAERITIITTPIGAGMDVKRAFAQMASAYDDRVARRILENACLIDF